MTVPRPPIELYDSDIDRIQQVWDTLRDRHQKSFRNFDAVEREIVGRFADAGFVAHVNWFRYEIDGVPQDGACGARTDGTRIADWPGLAQPVPRLPRTSGELR